MSVDTVSVTHCFLSFFFFYLRGYSVQIKSNGDGPSHSRAHTKKEVCYITNILEEPQDVNGNIFFQLIEGNTSQSQQKNKNLSYFLSIVSFLILNIFVGCLQGPRLSTHPFAPIVSLLGIFLFSLLGIWSTNFSSFDLSQSQCNPCTNLTLLRDTPTKEWEYLENESFY